MDAYRNQVFQQNIEIAKLNARINGLEEEGSDSAKNLEDVIKTNDALILENGRLKDQVSSLESMLNEKEKQINTLMGEYNSLVHKVKENAQRVALPVKSHELCQQC